MKSTTRLFDNIKKDDFRKCKIDLAHAVSTVVENRVEKRKKEVAAKLNK